MNAEEVYLGLGANLGSPRITFEKALSKISNFAVIEKVSKIYRSAPFGFSDQPPFVNAAVKITTQLIPQELLLNLQDIEKQLGKKVICKNGPRIIDLDLLVYGKISLQEENLTLPHPEILFRDFVLFPLNDLNPQLSHPNWGPKTLKSAINRLQKKYVEGHPDMWDIKR